VSAPWIFAIEREQRIPHQIALPDLDEEAARLVLACMADRFTPLEAQLLRIERAEAGREIRGVVLNTRTMDWQSLDGQYEGRGILELGCWLRRKTIIGTRAAIFGYLLLRGQR
jgi:hypothetical protein